MLVIKDMQNWMIYLLLCKHWDRSRYLQTLNSAGERKWPL